MSLRDKSFVVFLVVMVSLIAAALATKSQKPQTLPRDVSPEVIALGDGWYAAGQSTSLAKLQAWDSDMQRAIAKDCQFMGISTTDVTGRGDGRTSPPALENLYLCRDLAVPAQDVNEP